MEFLQGFVQYIWSGLAAGVLYAAAAMGFSLMLKTTGIFNFAYGDMAAAGAWFALVLITTYSLPIWASITLAVIVSAIGGVVLERFFIRPIRDADMGVGVKSTPMIMTFGVSSIIGGFLVANIPYPLKFPKLITGSMIEVGGVYISPESLMNLAIIVAIVFVLYLFFNHTTLGISMRAAAQDMITASLMGVPANAVFAVSWGVAAGLAAVAAILIAPSAAVSSNFMNDVLVKAFMAAIIGGMGNLPGALAGGLLVGVLDNLIAGYISSEMKAVFIFMIFLLLLMFRPQGILPTAKGRKI